MRTFFRFFLAFFLAGFPFIGFSQSEFKAGLTLQGYLKDGENPFWETANTLGIVSPETDGLGLLEVYYMGALNEKAALEVGGSLLFARASDRNADVAPNEYYASLNLGKFRGTLGARARPEQMMGLSSVNGDILWSNNARPLPGVEVGTIAPIQLWPWLGVEGALAHYWLNDPRYVEDPYVHYKQLTLHFQLSPRSRIRAGLHHYAQWAGVSPDRGPQPSSFGDFLRVFFDSMGDENASLADQQNALGNHLGSWRLHYQYTYNAGALEVYHQNLFEDSSGMEFGNFPDGIWGAFWTPTNTGWLKGLLYEYTQTTWQSGLTPLFGFDNYFNNSTYRSGWTYYDQVIGTPFFTYDPDVPGVINNAIIAHHLGLRAAFYDLDLRLRASLVDNRGTRAEPFIPSQSTFYTHIQLRHPLSPNAQLGLNLGADFSNLEENIFGVGVSFRFFIN